MTPTNPLVREEYRKRDRERGSVEVAAAKVCCFNITVPNMLKHYMSFQGSIQRVNSMYLYYPWWLVACLEVPRKAIILFRIDLRLPGALAGEEEAEEDCTSTGWASRGRGAGSSGW